MSNQRKLWLFILILGILFRIYRFGSVPTSLNRDEAALGYNAFAIASEGMDEWGNAYPLLFKSFGDYKLPGYIYLDSIFIKFLGVDDWVIRLPSLLAGIGIIFLTYSLARKLFDKKETGLIAAALISIQPWAVFYSRMAYEANLSLFFLLLSWWGWWQKSWRLRFVGSVSFLISILTYNTPLILAPVIILLILFLSGTPLKAKVFASGTIIVAFVAGIWLLSPITSQKQAITIFTDPTLTDLQARQYMASSNLLEKAYNHKYVFWFVESGIRWLKSWSPEFLIVRGGSNPWHNLPNGAHFFYTSYLLALIGMVMFIIIEPDKQKFLILAVICMSLLPAVVTVDAPHATRSLWFFWWLTVMAAATFEKADKWKSWFIALFILAEAGVFGYRYFIEFEKYHSSFWTNGIKSSLKLIPEDKRLTALVLISSKDGDPVADQLYIYPLLYWKVSPKFYQETLKISPPDNANLIRVGGFANLDISNYNQEGYQYIIDREENGEFKLK